MTTDFVVRGPDYIEDHQFDEYDENSSARLFERSRIKALADCQPLKDEPELRPKAPTIWNPKSTWKLMTNYLECQLLKTTKETETCLVHPFRAKPEHMPGNFKEAITRDWASFSVW